MKKLSIFIIIVFSAFYANAQETPINRIKLTNGADQIKFDVSGQNRYWFMSKTATDNKAFAMYSPEDGGWFTYWKEASGDMIVNKGKVGIGNTNPVSKLQVGLGTTNNPSAIAQFGSSNPNSEARVLSLVNYGGGSDQSTSIDFHNKASWSPTGKIQVQQRGTNTQSKINFYTFNGSLQNRMTISHNGDVGIGTSAPTSFGTSQPTLELRGSSVQRTGAIRGYSSDLSKGWFLGRADDSSLPDGLTIGTTDLNNINFRTATNTRMTINGNGNVGVGTMTPLAKLEVKGAGDQWIQVSHGNVGGLRIGSSNGDRLNLIYRKKSNDMVTLRAGHDHGELSFIAGGTNAERMRIKSNGNIGIGTINPDSKLTVKGTIHSEEVKVDLNVPGPDYVFEEDYDLISLEETKAYISANKHLPEVPSAKEMEASGINLSDMSMTLLKKIEEMTLHQIQLMETVKDQNSKIEKLQKEIESLKNK